MTGLDGATIARLDELVRHVAESTPCPALSWGVMLGGELVHHGAAGAMADGRPPRAGSVFRIASMTKSFTAATVLALRDDGQLSLDRPIAEVAPELAAITGPTTDSPPITLRHLLSMSSGLATDDPWADRHIDMPFDRFTELMAAGATFAGAPGTLLEYSNLGFGLIGRVVQRATGERVRAHCERRLLTPLGLEHTTWVAPEHDDWARPFRVDDHVASAETIEPLGDGEIAPMGGIWTTVPDLVRWISWLGEAFPARDGADDGPLRRSSRREMQSVQRAMPVVHTAAGGEGLDAVPERVEGGGYGFGLRVLHDDRFGHHVHHAGGFPGYGSNMRWLPGRGVGVVALANSTYAPMRQLTRRMLELLDDAGLVAPAVPTPSPALEPAGRALLALLNAWTDDEATRVLEDNVLLDDPPPRLRAAAEAFVAEHGTLTFGSLEVETAAAGTIHATAADGLAVTLPFSIGPALPPRVQDYEIVTGAAPRPAEEPDD